MASIERLGEASSRARIIGLASEICQVLADADFPEEYFAALGMAAGLFIHNNHFKHREEAMKAMAMNIEVALTDLEARHRDDAGSILTLG